MNADRSIVWGLTVIVMISFVETLDGLLKDHAVAVFTSDDTLSGQDSYTTSLDLSRFRSGTSYGH